MRRPLLMMRTRGLSGPLFGKHVGNRASHPLAHSVGNAISAGAVETLGPELIVNGSFADGATGWNLGTGWSVSDGVATGVPGSASLIGQNPLLILGNIYRVTWTILIVSAGTTAPQAQGAIGTPIASIGTYFEDLVATAAGASGISKNATFDGVIDNISLREVIPGV